MSDEMTPIHCGCGGEAKVEEWVGQWYVRCQKSNCLISTKNYDTEAEAIQAWNTAMGKRTAKVDWINGEPYCPMCGDRLEWE